MQRVLDPAQIEAFAQRTIPRIRLPDPARVFSDRAARLLKLSEGHAVGDYLRLMATVANAQQEALDRRTQATSRGHQQLLGVDAFRAGSIIQATAIRPIGTSFPDPPGP